MLSKTGRTNSAFDAQERSWLRQELSPQFGVSPLIADGFLLKVWKSGPLKGSARLSPPVAKMGKRGLLVVHATDTGQRAFLTYSGIEELRSLFLNMRPQDLAEFGDLHLQLVYASAPKDEEIASAMSGTKTTHKSTP